MNDGNGEDSDGYGERKGRTVTGRNSEKMVIMVMTVIGKRIGRVVTARDGEEDGDTCEMEKKERTGDWCGWCADDGDGCGD